MAHFIQLLGHRKTKTSKMLPPVAAVLPVEKLNETLVKWGLLPCCRFSGPLSINMTFLAIFDQLSLRPSGLKGRSPLRGANPFLRHSVRVCGQIRIRLRLRRAVIFVAKVAFGIQTSLVIPVKTDKLMPC
jgi:hypothetical protein